MRAHRWLIALLLALAPAVAAADVVVAARVVKTDRREIYVSLGEGAGVVEGAKLRLKRPITLRHPVTRAAVVDWLPLGDGTVTDVGTQLSRIALPPELLTQVKVGDVAEVYVERSEQVAPPPPPPPAPTDDRPMPTVDPDTASVLTVWRATTGAGLDARIAAWSGWLADHGESRFAADVRADLEVLRATREATRPDGAARARSVNLQVDHAPPTRAEPGQAITLAFVLAEPERVVAASLHARRRGEPQFTRYELVREHGIYLRGVLPAELAVAPGLEYFVEALDDEGDAAAAFGGDAQPIAITVDPPPVASRFAPVRRRTQLSLSGSYLDFATFDDRTDGGADQDRTDTFAEAAVDVLYRLDGLLWGVRLGFGSYGGRGGFANAVWTDAVPAPRVGFQFGYVEAELRFPVRNGPPVGLAGRFIAGVGREGFGLGAAGRLRLGDADGTNLSFGGTITEQVGFLTDLRLETWPRRDLPVGIAVGVTDQPGNGDLGVRLSADVGYQLRPWVRPTVRGSWQGRSATHAGLGGGLGLVFDW